MTQFVDEKDSRVNSLLSNGINLKKNIAMNEKQKQRYWELREKKTLSASQREELATLEGKAVSAGLSLESLEPASSGSSITENELSEIVKSSVEDQLFGLREELLDELQKSTDSDDIEAIVKKYAANVDVDDLTDKIGEKVAGSTLDVESLTEAFKNAVGSIKTDSKMEHSATKDEENVPLIEMPFGDSKHSLTVGMKQLHNIMCKKHMNEGIPESSLKIAEARGRQLEEGQKGLTTGTTGGGEAGSHLSRVNVDLSSTLNERLYAESAIARRFQGSELTMPTNPFKLPVVNARPQFQIIAEAADSSGAKDDVGTANVTLDTFKLVGIAEYSYEVDEDSVLAILPIITNQLSSSAADALEDAIINGADQAVASSHQDTLDSAGTAIATTSPSMACNGLRKLGLTSGLAVDAGDAAFTPDLVGSMRAALGVYGLRPQDLALIVSIADYNTLLVDDNTATYQLWGGGNTLQNGQLPQIWGIDIVPSSQMRDDLDDDGVNSSTGANNVHSAACLVHVPSYVVGVKRGFTVEIDNDKYKQTNAVIASFRRDFQPIGTPDATKFPTVSTLHEIK